MDVQFNAILSIAIIPHVINLIMESEEMDEIKAIECFYKSKTYESLANEETKVWHYSPKMIHVMWQYEKETGEPFYPEEAA